MSEREQIEERLVSYLEGQTYRFTAPYGVLTGMLPVGKGGYLRQITFGVARYLDATITIYTPKKIAIRGQGALARKYNGEYKSVEEVLVKLTEE